jgi:hypothetical protein
VRAAALVAALVLAGCGITSTSSGGIAYPAGPSLAEFHVRERCGAQDDSCHERARTVLDEILTALGGPADDPVVQSPDEPPAQGRLTIVFDSQPAFEFQAPDGEQRSSERVVVDVTGALRGGESYAVVGDGLAYQVHPEQAEDLLFALFVLTD